MRPDALRALEEALSDLGVPKKEIAENPTKAGMQFVFGALPKSEKSEAGQEVWRLSNGLRMAHWLPPRLEAAFLRGRLTDARALDATDRQEASRYARDVLRAFGIDSLPAPSEDGNAT